MSRPCVLVVDPNPATLRRVQEAFADTDLAMVGARHAPEAEEVAEGQDVALVLSCASLPKGNGYELARSFREHHPAASVMLMVGGFDVFNSARAEESGVAAHIRRPFSPGTLREQAESLIGPIDVLDPNDHATVSFEDLPGFDPAGLTPEPAPAPRRAGFVPPASGGRVATILPRDYQDLPLVQVDPDVVGPALERAILEVLPEVVEIVLRNALTSTGTLRSLVEHAVQEAVQDQLPDIARQAVEARIAEVEAGAENGQH